MWSIDKNTCILFIFNSSKILEIGCLLRIQQLLHCIWHIKPFLYLIFNIPIILDPLPSCERLLSFILTIYSTKHYTFWPLVTFAFWQPTLIHLCFKPFCFSLPNHFFVFLFTPKPIASLVGIPLLVHIQDISFMACKQALSRNSFPFTFQHWDHFFIYCFLASWPSLRLFFFPTSTPYFR